MSRNEGAGLEAASIFSAGEFKPIPLSLKIGIFPQEWSHPLLTCSTGLKYLARTLNLSPPLRSSQEHVSVVTVE